MESRDASALGFFSKKSLRKVLEWRITRCVQPYITFSWGGRVETDLLGAFILFLDEITYPLRGVLYQIITGIDMTATDGQESQGNIKSDRCSRREGILADLQKRREVGSYQVDIRQGFKVVGSAKPATACGAVAIQSTSLLFHFLYMKLIIQDR